MIEIIGTTHLMSKEAIEGIIKDKNPDVIGVELCKTRFKVFTNQIQSNKQKDDSLMGKIAEETRKKAEKENLDYGSDMKTAMFYAINNNIPLILVDKDILEIKNDMQNIPIDEMIYLQKELIKFQQEELKTEIDENDVIERVKSDIPKTYKILVEDRNNYIINKIKEEEKNYKNKRILIFLGKGHIQEIQRSINNE